MAFASKRSPSMLRGGICLLLATAWVAVPGAQTGERYRDRLSRLPVDRATTAAISGQGTVAAALAGDQLTITATFEDMSSDATVAHIHRGPRAQPGPVVFSLEVPSAASGTVTETLTLSEAERETLRRGSYYLQIHTTQNPGGELRGWLLPE